MLATASNRELQWGRNCNGGMGRRKEADRERNSARYQAEQKKGKRLEGYAFKLMDRPR